MAPNSRVLIFEDDPDIANMERDSLESNGHTVVGVCGDIESLELFLKTDEAKTANVGIFDNQAPWHPGDEPDDHGVGNAAVKCAREALGDITTVAYTTSKKANYGDVRYEGRVSGIGEFVTALPHKEF